MRILILGCGGFIGSHLVERVLKDTKHHIKGVDLSDYKIKVHTEDPRFLFHKRDVYEDATMLSMDIAHSDVVIFLATICHPSLYNTQPLKTIRSNFTQPCQVVDLCAEHKKWLINVSTCEVYGRTLLSYVEPDAYTDELYLQREDETPLIMGPIQNQRWSYACAKQLLDRYIYGQGYENGLEYTIIRPYNFFGPRMDYIPEKDGEGTPRVLACFLKALMDGEPMKLVDGGEQRRTITYIDDAIDAFMRILERPKQSKNQVFNIGNPDNQISMSDLAEMMRGIYSSLLMDESYLQHPIESVSSEDFYGPGYEDCDQREPDITKAQELLGWNPKTDLHETMRHTMRYFFEHYVQPVFDPS